MSVGVHARGKTGNWTGNIRGGEGREVRTRDDCRDYELIECWMLRVNLLILGKGSCVFLLNHALELVRLRARHVEKEMCKYILVFWVFFPTLWWTTERGLKLFGIPTVGIPAGANKFPCNELVIYVGDFLFGFVILSLRFFFFFF